MRTNHKRVIIIAACVLVLYAIMKNHTIFMSVIASFMRVMTPFIIGGIIAFIVNIPMNFFEKRVLGKRKCFQSKRGKTARRGVSIVITLLLVLLIINVVLSMLLPQLYNSLALIGKQLRVEMTQIPQYFDTLATWIPALDDQIFELKQAWLNINWTKISADVLNFLQAGGFFTNTVNMASGIISGIVNFGIGLVFAVYCLFQKETLMKQGKKLLYALFSEKRVDHFLEVCRLACTTFQHFFSGQCLEALILGTLFLIVLLVFQFPYALIISVLVSVTALIPVFGSFISCVVGAILLLMDSPIRALWFVIIFLILQQLEGNFIYPKVVGGSIGLPAIWVFVAVTLGASISGVMGMIIAIPLTSVVYALLREYVQRRIIEKNISKRKFESRAEGES